MRNAGLEEAQAGIKIVGSPKCVRVGSWSRAVGNVRRERSKITVTSGCGEGNLPAQAWQNHTAGLTAHWMLWSWI